MNNIDSGIQLNGEILTYCEHGTFKDTVMKEFIRRGYKEDHIRKAIDELVSSKQIEDVDIKGDSMLVTLKDYSKEVKRSNTGLLRWLREINRKIRNIFSDR